MLYFLSVAKYIFLLMLLGNFVFFFTYRWTSKPKSQGKISPDSKVAESQHRLLTKYKKMIRNRYILINSVPILLLLITIIVTLIKNNSLKNAWGGLAILAEFFTAVVYLTYFNFYKHGNSHEIQPDGSLKLYRIDKFFLCLYSFGGLFIWFGLVIFVIVKFLLLR